MISRLLTLCNPLTPCFLLLPSSQHDCATLSCRRKMRRSNSRLPRQHVRSSEGRRRLTELQVQHQLLQRQQLQRQLQQRRQRHSGLIPAGVWTDNLQPQAIRSLTHMPGVCAR